MAEPIVRIRDLVKEPSARGSEDIHVLAGLSLEMPRAISSR